MKCEFLISGAPEKYIRFIAKLFKKEIVCITTAKRNVTDGTIVVFEREIPVKVSMKKGEQYFVVRGDLHELNSIKRWLFPFGNAKVYPAEYIICQKKWRGQPYKFFFKDSFKAAV